MGAWGRAQGEPPVRTALLDTYWGTCVRRHHTRRNSTAAILRLQPFFNLPRFTEIQYLLPLEQVLLGASMPRSTTTSKPRSFVVIPARYASTRLPRKMLLRETGKTLLQHTYESACA